jgi:hypothetical protein
VRKKLKEKQRKNVDDLKRNSEELPKRRSKDVEPLGMHI